jgi:hybrid cluster-associated redox disulfide protein
MVRTPTVHPDMLVDEVMRRWPQTIRVLVRRRMLCVGCPIGTFHTVSEACREHNVPEGEFLMELEAVLAG